MGPCQALFLYALSAESMVWLGFIDVYSTSNLNDYNILWDDICLHYIAFARTKASYQSLQFGSMFYGTYSLRLNGKLILSTFFSFPNFPWDFASNSSRSRPYLATMVTCVFCRRVWMCKLDIFVIFMHTIEIWLYILCSTIIHISQE